MTILISSFSQTSLDRLARKRKHPKSHRVNIKRGWELQANPGEPLELPTLTESWQDLSDADFVELLAMNMCEHKPELISNVVQTLGKEVAAEVCCCSVRMFMFPSALHFIVLVTCESNQV